MRDNPDVQAWIDEARHMPVLDAVQHALPAFAAGMKRNARDHYAGCPACNSRDSYVITPSKGKWICRRGGTGGSDGIGAVMHAAGVEFLAAVEMITGRANPAGSAMSEADKAALRRKNALSQAHWRGRAVFDALAAHGQGAATAQAHVPADCDDDRDVMQAFIAGFRAAQDKWKIEQRYRDAARDRALDIWRAALPMAHAQSRVIDYFAHRGIFTLPHGIVLRYAPSLDYREQFKDADGKTAWRVAHRGPTIVAPIINRGMLTGIHRTPIAFDGARFTTGKGTASVRSETGEPLTKMALGDKKGGIIPLGGGADADEPTRYSNARVIVLGEGRETVLAVAHRWRQSGRDLRGVFFASAIDLGNMGGRARGRVKHPTRMTTPKQGKPYAAWTGDAEPDYAEPGLWIPPVCEELFLLRDGDSDPFDTENALQRCAKKAMAERQTLMRKGEARSPLAVRIADAPAGMDFDDFNRATQVAA